MLTEVCTGENISNFKEGSSGLNFHCPVENLPLSEQVSESFYMRDNDSSQSVDVQDLSGVDVQEGSFGVNLTSVVETLSVSRMLSDPSCTENDDLSKSVDAQDITGDFQEGSSAMDLKCNVDKSCVSHQLSDPSCTEYNDFSNNLDTHDFSGADFWEGSSAFDIKANVEKLLVTQPLSDPSCTENDDLSKNVDAQGLSGIDVREGSSSIDPSSTVGNLPGSDPSCTENDDFFKDVNAQDLSGIDVREGSSAIDPNSTVGNIPGSDPSCTEYDDLSTSMAAQDLSRIDVQEGSSAIDPKSTGGVIPWSDPSCTENDDFSKDVNAQDLSGADLRGGSSAIDERLSVNQRLCDPSSTENNDMSKTVDAQDLSGDDLQEGLFPMNLKSTAEISTVSEQLSEPSISKNDDFSKSMDSLALSGADFSEQLYTMDLDSTIVKLSVFQQLSEPSCVGDINVNKSMDVHLQDEVSVAALDCINNTGEPFGQSDNGGKGCIMVDGASEANLADIMCVSPQKRSLRKTRSRQSAQTAKPTRSQRNLTNRKMSLDFNSLQITRRRRSIVVKRARSSVWGLLTDVQVLEQNGTIDSNVNEHKKPSRARGGQARGKQEKNQSQSKKSNKKKSSITGRISSKGKVGEEVGSSSAMDAFSTDIDIEKHFKTKVKFPDLAKGEDLPRSIGSQGCKENLDSIVALSDDSVLDFSHAGKGLVENLVTKTSNDCQQFMSGEEVDKLRTPSDSMGLDPGTSPDSEVINLNLDAPLVGKDLEDLHDILSSSHVCDASEDAFSLSPMRKCIKKGKKKKKMVQPSDCSAGDELMNSEIVETDQQLVEAEQGEKGSDVSYSADASVTTANASGNTSSTEGISKEPLPSRVADFGISCVTCKVGGSEINLSTSVGTEFESQMSNKVLPRNKGRKIPKSAKTAGVRKGRSEVPTSANKKETTTRKMVNRDKSASKLKLKDEVNGGLASCEVEDRVETDLGESGTGNSSLTGEVSTLDIDHKGVMEQYTKPRNAWVLCDDCHKWRRIQATLADQIEESNCRWTCKDSMDKNFADCSVAQEKSNAEINAELEISDASCDEDACDARRNSNQLSKNQSAVVQQSKWKLIRSNLFLHRNRKTQTIDEIMVCHCKAPSDGGMGCGDGCLNRMLNIECVRGTCPCGELCSNQQFQKRKYAKLECFKCGKKGFGLQGLEDISEGQFLIEYVGEVLDMHAYEARQKEYALHGHKHFYFMTLNGSEVIDACAKGNLGRFINHSCDPNCRTEKWMVNGEVCIGLFALRNIKKGEELTFDYNYVRVFGAAAKKCVCGSSQCRGYIGGDPQNAEVIVQDESDDEYPEPVMVCEDGLVDENLNVTMPVRSSFGCTETMTAKKSPKDMDKLNESVRIYKHLDVASEVLSAENEVPEKVETDNSATAVGHVEIIEESGDSLHRSSSAALKVDISVEIDVSTGQLRSLDQPQTSLNPDDLSSEIVTIGEQECSGAERSMKRSSCSTAAFEENSPGTMVSKLLPDVMDSKRKLKSNIGKRRVKSSKSHPCTKASRPSSIKKEKPKGLPVNGKKLQEMHSKLDVLSCKSKKIVDVSSGGRFEAVQEKLGALLDHDGGISKRRDSSRGYLKLLLLTAASGDSGNGETIQSNRDLSMILDALLKTKSRTVLVDIINKNGLQMLHNMLKRYRKEFNKIPILRKLLKGFEYLATREILTSEHINGGPPCPGVESFRESILSFTEHTDRQVHQIARNFRDRWIPRSFRKNNCMEWEDGKMEFHRGSDSSRFRTHNNWSDRSGRHSETPDCITQPIVTSSTVDAGSVPSCSSGARTRKRKSRWDQPGDLDIRVETNIASDGKQTIDDDVPPGFAVPFGASVVPSEVSSNSRCVRPKLSGDLKLEHETVMGHPQQRFLSRLPVSYGVPLCIAQQVGTPQPGSLEGWSIAPGMPFNPFPPLPSYPRHKTDPMSNVADSSVAEQDCNRSANHHSGVNPPSSSRASSFDVEPPDEKNRLNFQQTRESSTLGRRYFRQQKWNNTKPCPPWIRNRNNWGPMGNNTRNGMYNVGLGNGTNEFRNSHGMEKANGEVDGSAYHHHHHHHQPPQY